jgi:hypothetical protein
MSHFSVGVIVKDLSELEDVLAPFSEQIEVEPYIYETKQQLIERHKKYFSEESNGLTDEEVFELVKKNYENDKPGLDDEGNCLTTYNPKSKWDWYVIGGRWGYKIKLKNGETVNYAQIKDIDFSPDKEEYESAKRFWEIYIDKQSCAEEEERHMFDLYAPEYYINKYETKENYANSCAKFTTYALLYDGKWYEKGKMGWFGMSDETKESIDSYEQTFDKILKQASPTNYFVMVDCHI